MQPQKKPSLKDVKEIVINRISIWVLVSGIDLIPRWKKVVGGPGFNHKGSERATIKSSAEMHMHIAELLTRKRRVQLFRNNRVGLLQEEPAYGWWKSGYTLNIARNAEPVSTDYKGIATRARNKYNELVDFLCETEARWAKAEPGDPVNPDEEDVFTTAVQEYELLHKILKVGGKPRWYT